MRLFQRVYAPGIALLLAAGMWLYAHQVLRPYERQRYAALGQQATKHIALAGGGHRIEGHERASMVR